MPLGKYKKQKPNKKTAMKTRRAKKQEEPDNILPEDSVSQVGMKIEDGRRSVVSTTSSVAARRLELLLNRAKLEAQLLAEKERQEIAMEELRLEQRKQGLDTKLELLAMEAEDKLLSQLQSNSTTGSKVNEVTKTNVDQSKNEINAVNQSIPANSINNNNNQGLNVNANNFIPAQQSSNNIVSIGDSASITQMILDNQRQQHELIDSIRLPASQTMTFDGDALKYWTFMRAFDSVVEKSKLDDNAKLVRLVQSCVGKARKVIESCLMMDSQIGYVRARSLLKERFGNEFTIASAWIDKIKIYRAIKPNEREKLQDFADDLSSCHDTLVSMGQTSEVNNQSVLCSIIEKLPIYLQTKFKHEARLIREQRKRNPEFADIVHFIKDAATEANDPVYGALAATSRETSSVGGRNHVAITAAATQSQSLQPNQQVTAKYQIRKCVVCQDTHDLFNCANFKAMSVDERIQTAKSNKLCFNCLKPNHTAEKCRATRTCSIQGCTKKHTKFLHKSTSGSSDNGANRSHPSTSATNGHVTGSIMLETVIEEEQHISTQPNVTNGHIGAGALRSALPIVPVLVFNPVTQESLHTHALLDTGSTNSFCTGSLARRLGATGHKEMLSLSTLEKANSRGMTQVVKLKVSDINGENVIDMDKVYVKMDLPIGLGNMATSVDISHWPHLNSIQLPAVNIGSVELLIGQDTPEALIPIDVLRGEPNSPYAVKTILGWALHGPLGMKRDNIQTVLSNFIQSDCDLEQQLERFWTFDTIPVHQDTSEWSANDRRVMDLWSTTTILKEGHYEVAIPFKSTMSLPNNEKIARERLNKLKIKLKKNTQLHHQYTTYMSDLLSKEYAEMIPLNTGDDVITDAIWYLPHHPVFNVNKPGKLRVVFDCSAKCSDVSLNDCVLQGPDLTNKLTGILLRFRQEPVALMADVEAMFYQVKVKLEHRNVLRYLWWPEGNLDAEPVCYRMTVHPFGGIWSPSCCNYALHRTAEDRTLTYSREAVATVIRNFYVDDCVKSVASIQDGRTLVNELNSLLLEGGFKLTKWISNCPAALDNVQETDLCPAMKTTELMLTEHERALGVKWQVDTDKLGVSVVNKDKPHTRKGMLSIVSSIFDPLGFVSPYVLTAKKMMQELCRRKLGWNDELPPDILQSWMAWLEDQLKLKEFGVPRCIKPNGFETVRCELHHFSDASRDSYGTASYLRLIDNAGNVHCNLIIAKTRLAPIRQMTIPRLELSAATVSVSVDKYLRRELDIKINRSMFWTDSTITLQYIRSEDRRYHTFVANRVAQIREGSEPSQWHYVNTKVNPADFASRGLKAEELIDNKLWLEGPLFLKENENQWPEQPTIQMIACNDAEVRSPPAIYAVEVQINDDITAMTKLFRHFSSFFKLKKATAWLIRVKCLLMKKVRKEEVPNMTASLSVSEIEQAETEILKYVQQESFHPNESLKKSNPLLKLEPQMVDGVLRIGGRLTSHQIILPKKHVVVDLIVKQYHEQSCHSGQEHVLSLVREHYWIISARRVVKKILFECRHCRLKFPKPLIQKMANLPRERQTSDEPPFTCTGVDYFGPITVKSGRNQLKRYGCLFTCFSSRAVHVEIAHSLDSDSFLNAFQRFVARRGQPAILWSDNGTNFVGAHKELQKAIRSLDNSRVHDFMTTRNIKWKFNPPAASHMGGVWERLIRSVRKVLTALANEQSLTDETLHTFACLAENVVNSRPLSTVSDDPRDFSPLTPNHLLQLRTSQVMPLGIFDAKDMYARRRWKQCQYLTDVFWSRWRKEYLPSLQLRGKWLANKHNLRIGDVVLLVDDQAPRNCWSLGRVTETYPGADDLVRSVKVNTRDSSFVRPIHKLCLIESAL